LNKFAWRVGIPLKKLEELASNAEDFYSPFPKKTGTKERMIDNPTGFLKEVQYKINNRILGYILFPNYIIGGVKGQKPLNHPKRHIRRSVIVTIDAKECFPNITNKRVFDIWFRQLGCSSTVARLATKLTTRKGHLPLGAFTSNCLANLALLPCVKEAVQIANRFHWSTPTQYIDDEAFSGNKLPKQLISLIIKGFSRRGIKIHRKKICIMRSNTSQRITGKIVNRKVAIPRSERNKVRAALNELAKTNSTDPMYSKHYRSVRGRISNLKNLHPQLAAKMLKQFKTFKKPR